MTYRIVPVYRDCWLRSIVVQPAGHTTGGIDRAAERESRRAAIGPGPGVATSWPAPVKVGGSVARGGEASVAHGHVFPPWINVLIRIAPAPHGVPTRVPRPLSRDSPFGDLQAPIMRRVVA
jgi:hypothetical protein